MPSYIGSSSDFAEKIAPIVQAALEGKRSVPEQTPFAEAWLGLSLYYAEGPVPLDEIIRIADGINHDYPKADHVSWALKRLRSRGWLVVREKSYGLTPEGRHTIESVVGEGSVLQKLDRLNKWISTNPLHGQ